MQRDLVAYRWDVVDAIDSIFSFCGDMTYEQYLAVPLVQAAIERKFEVIGEAIRQMEEFFPGSLNGIVDGPQAKAVRNRLAHGYFDIDHRVLWETIKNDLPSMRAQLGSLLAGEQTQ